MAVHAHPDDEAVGTGGVLARYADEGIRTVLVTCTNGELGDGPGGVKPDEEGHNESAVALHRRSELEASCEVLGIAHLELLGYHDSGMMGWRHNDAPFSFWKTPLDEAAAKLGALIERYRPQVVVTYDENGFYGHPDHIKAHHVAKAATEQTGIPDKLYYTAVPLSAFKELATRMRELDLSFGDNAPDFDPENPPFGTPDDLIDAVVDVSAYVSRKRAALAAHSSQTENAFFLKMPPEVFELAFGQEAFVRSFDRSGAPTPEADLFAGLRP
jgi:LmbE family N-acetylglucosaminyl deacetylase